MICYFWQDSDLDELDHLGRLDTDFRSVHAPDHTDTEQAGSHTVKDPTPVAEINSGGPPPTLRPDMDSSRQRPSSELTENEETYSKEFYVDYHPPPSDAGGEEKNPQAV